VGEAARLPNAEALGVHYLAASYNVGWADPGHVLLRDPTSSFIHPTPARPVALADSWEDDGVGTTAATTPAVEARAGLLEVRLRRGVVDGEPP
jgi:hypothetical protein